MQNLFVRNGGPMIFGSLNDGVVLLMAFTVAFALDSCPARAKDRDKEDTKARIEHSFQPLSESMHRSELAPSVGLSLGVASPEASFGTVAEYGVNAAIQVWKPLGVGVELSGLSSNRSLGGQPQDLNRTNILLTAAYHLGGDIPVLRHSYFGLGLGPVIDTNAYRGTHSGIAPMAGFDIPLADPRMEYFSLGVAAKYLFVSGPSPDTVAVNGVLKYWF